MRAEEGDESVNDYADEARQAQSKVTGPNSRRWPRNVFRLIGSGEKVGAAEKVEVRNPRTMRGARTPVSTLSPDIGPASVP